MVAIKPMMATKIAKSAKETFFLLLITALLMVVILRKSGAIRHRILEIFFTNN